MNTKIKSLLLMLIMLMSMVSFSSVAFAQAPPELPDPFADEDTEEPPTLTLEEEPPTLTLPEEDTEEPPTLTLPDTTTPDEEEDDTTVLPAATEDDTEEPPTLALPDTTSPQSGDTNTSAPAQNTPAHAAAADVPAMSDSGPEVYVLLLAAMLGAGYLEFRKQRN